jgi:hypothetical protein
LSSISLDPFLASRGATQLGNAVKDLGRTQTAYLPLFSGTSVGAGLNGVVSRDLEIPETPCFHRGKIFHGVDNWECQFLAVVVIRDVVRTAIQHFMLGF